jgi:peptide/nickel transport system ATP-binding protein
MALQNQSTVNASTGEETVLNIDSLHVEYSTPRGGVQAVRDVSLDVHRGETFGIAGESGSGKSTLALAILQYLGENGHITDGTIDFEGQPLGDLFQSELLSIRGNEIAHVAQDAAKALNPSLTVGEQIAETIRKHRDISQSEAREHALEMLEKVNIPDPGYHAEKYVHELSGGQQQRVLVAIALSCNPDMLILDEPTTGLDVTTQVKIIDLIKDLKAEFNTTILLITHNLEIIAQITDRVAIMYAGEFMEKGPTERVFANPTNPYTQGLLGATPEIGSDKEPSEIPGQVPSLTDIPSGCVFADRCAFATDECREGSIELGYVEEQHETRCVRWEHVVENPLEAGDGSLAQVEQGSELLSAEGVRKHFDEPTTFSRVMSNGPLADYFETEPPVQAVSGVDLTIHESETVGLVGESGSGKSTLGRTLLQLLEPTAGTVEFRGDDVDDFDKKEMREFYAECQLVFQNPHSSLNPRKSIFEIVDRPIELFTDIDEAERAERVQELLTQVDLGPEYMPRYPHELSGGEKQRVAIARAFAPNPSLIVLDEPVSALDVSVQANILNLLSELREEYGTAYFLISHDLGVISAICDRINVMYLGEIVESGSRNEIFEPPYHPYTRALLSSIPTLDPTEKTDPIRLEGDVPSPRTPPSGCSFNTRCPQKIGDICENECPELKEAADDGSHSISCHLSEAEMSIDLEELKRKDSTDTVR